MSYYFTYARALENLTAPAVRVGIQAVVSSNFS